MTLNETLKYYGSFQAIADALGIPVTVVRNWQSRGYIPKLQQYRLEKLTAGELKME